MMLLAFLSIVKKGPLPLLFSPLTSPKKLNVNMPIFSFLYNKFIKRTSLKKFLSKVFLQL